MTRRVHNRPVTAIVLTTLNARYSHASLGLRYLRANLGELHAESVIREFVIGQKTEEMVESLLAEQPKIIGVGVYIWNVEECTRLVAQLKAVAPDILIVLGGPEVSYETDGQRICQLADHVITGWGDTSFAALARQLLRGERPATKVIAGIQAPLPALTLPYREFTDEDVRQRHLYVEASRGCPFKCEFCLSALDKTAWPFELDPFLAELEILYQRGARTFKFVDRTFNLKVDTSLAILDFFLKKLELAPDDPVFAHFELIPDHLPGKLKNAIAKFPEGSLQFEIGIQTFDVDVQARVSRRQKNDVASANIRWLREHSTAHLHVDLIAGLPGEDMATFATGFNRLVQLAPHEIQFGILKRLRGAPIARHTVEHGLKFNPDPPYNILATKVIDFASMQRLSRFSRYWDIVANSGRYSRTLPLLLADDAFGNFLAFSDWLFATTGKTHAIAHERVVIFLHEYLCSLPGVNEALISATLVTDYRAAGGRTHFDFEAPGGPRPLTKSRQKAGATPSRQVRHLQGDG
jgi:radical SAM superfamily enzyme YgiQ (UPF0313 family)